MAAKRKITYDEAITRTMQQQNCELNKPGKDLIADILEEIHLNFIKNCEREYESTKVITDSDVINCVRKAVSKTLPTGLRPHAMAEASRKSNLFQQGTSRDTEPASPAPKRYSAAQKRKSEIHSPEKRSKSNASSSIRKRKGKVEELNFSKGILDFAQHKSSVTVGRPATQRINSCLLGTSRDTEPAPPAPKRHSAAQKRKSEIHSPERRSKSKASSSIRKSKAKVEELNFSKGILDFAQHSYKSSVSVGRPATQRINSFLLGTSRDTEPAPPAPKRHSAAQKRKSEIHSPEKRSKCKASSSIRKSKVKVEELNFSKGIQDFAQYSYKSSVSVGRPATQRINSFLLDVCQFLITECASQHTSLTAEAIRATAEQCFPSQIGRHALASADTELSLSQMNLTAATSRQRDNEYEARTGNIPAESQPESQTEIIDLESEESETATEKV